MDEETMIINRIKALKRDRDKLLEDNKQWRGFGSSQHGVGQSKQISEEFGNKISELEVKLETLRRRHRVDETKAKASHRKKRKRSRGAIDNVTESLSTHSLGEPHSSTSHKPDGFVLKHSLAPSMTTNDGVNVKVQQLDNGVVHTEAAACTYEHSNELEIDNNSDALKEISSEDDSEIEDDECDEVYNIQKIKKSNLRIVCQGFLTNAKEQQSKDTEDSKKASHPSHYDPFDPEEVVYKGKSYRKGRCYIVDVGEFSCTVGIQYFVTKKIAKCILIEWFENTILGTEEEGSKYKADFMTGTPVQIYEHTQELPLSMFVKVAEEVQEMPSMIYQPQTPGNWYTCGYWLDQGMPQLKLNPNGEIRMLEVFAGGGGSWLGHHLNGFKTVLAIEINKDAVSTLKENATKMNTEINVYPGCVKEFIKNYATLKCVLGRIDHLWFSSPCQDFSSACWKPNKDSRDRADLSLTLIDLVRLTSCSTAVFENVIGIWKRNNIEYIKNIAKELMKLGYQTKWTVLYACDYGDPQKRGRFIMYIWKNSVPAPFYPPRRRMALVPGSHTKQFKGRYHSRLMHQQQI